MFYAVIWLNYSHVFLNWVINDYMALLGIVRVELERILLMLSWFSKVTKILDNNFGKDDT